MAIELADDPAVVIASLIERGRLIPVMVFGTDDCCEHGPNADCESTSYGLCDRFTHVGSVGSDCNRAAWFLMRPDDDLMDDERVRAALRTVLDDPEPKEPPKWR